MPISSPVDLGLPQTPITGNQELFIELTPIYNAFRKLLEAILAIEETQSNVPGPPGPPGPSLMIPYFIPLGDTFFVPLYKQALFSIPIDNEGIIDVDGYLVEVD